MMALGRASSQNDSLAPEYIPPKQGSLTAHELGHSPC